MQFRLLPPPLCNQVRGTPLQNSFCGVQSAMTYRQPPVQNHDSFYFTDRSSIHREHDHLRCWKDPSMIPTKVSAPCKKTCREHWMLSHLDIPTFQFFLCSASLGPVVLFLGLGSQNKGFDTWVIIPLFIFFVSGRGVAVSLSKFRESSEHIRCYFMTARFENKNWGP